jgi:DNA repair protein RecO (recombination protein O)
MLHKTRGIALSYIRYRESSIIAKIYTEEFGIQSYIVNGVRSSKAKTNRIALFQPLTLLDMVVYHKNQEQGLRRLSEIKCSLPFRSLPFDAAKSSIALFLTEILIKTLQEEEKNEPLFEFLMQTVVDLENITDNFENYHLMILCQLTHYLGFGTSSAQEIERQLTEYLYPHPLDETSINVLAFYLMVNRYEIQPLDRQRRNQLLDALVFYYKIHLDGLGEIRSLEVLREVFL